MKIKGKGANIIQPITRGKKKKAPIKNEIYNEIPPKWNIRWYLFSLINVLILIFSKELIITLSMITFLHASVFSNF